ncbi:MAG: DUF1178 family protein [Desulfobacteraceae bacterium]|jgi:hypothetical protein
MIVFDLECSEGHIFEAWFNNTESFEQQKAKGMISCPYCSDNLVSKVISPVTTKISPQPDATTEEESIDYARLAKEIVDYVDKNFDDVGTEFAKEALKMHYDVAEKRNIKGSATADEEKMLEDEGIEFFKLAVPKKDDEKKN